MGTLSGGGKEVISVGRRCLIGANAGIGISLGDDCVVEAGLYVTAGTKVTLQPSGEVVAARTLSGQDGAAAAPQLGDRCGRGAAARGPRHRVERGAARELTQVEVSGAVADPPDRDGLHRAGGEQHRDRRGIATGRVDEHAHDQRAEPGDGVADAEREPARGGARRGVRSAPGDHGQPQREARADADPHERRPQPRADSGRLGQQQRAERPGQPAGQRQPRPEGHRRRRSAIAGASSAAGICATLHTASSRPARSGGQPCAS